WTRPPTTKMSSTGRKTSPISTRRSRRAANDGAGTKRNASPQGLARRAAGMHRANGAMPKSARALPVNAPPNKVLARTAASPRPDRTGPQASGKAVMAGEEEGRVPGRAGLRQLLDPSPTTRETRRTDPRPRRAVAGRMFRARGVPRGRQGPRRLLVALLEAPVRIRHYRYRFGTGHLFGHPPFRGLPVQ